MHFLLSAAGWVFRQRNNYPDTLRTRTKDRTEMSDSLADTVVNLTKVTLRTIDCSGGEPIGYNPEISQGSVNEYQLEEAVGSFCKQKAAYAGGLWIRRKRCVKFGPAPIRALPPTDCYRSVDTAGMSLFDETICRPLLDPHCSSNYSNISNLIYSHLDARAGFGSPHHPSSEPVVD